MPVRLDPAAGIAHLGPRQVPIRLRGASGALQIGGDDGPVVRSLAFMERTRLAVHAAASHTPHHALGKLIADAALVEPGTGDERTVAIIAMTLAGATERDLPAYSETALLIAQVAGWSLEQLGQTDAVEVDRLSRLLATTDDDGWTRLLFRPPTETDLATIYQTLAENLLVRLQPTGLFDRSNPTAARAQQDNHEAQLTTGHPRRTAAPTAHPSMPTSVPAGPPAQSSSTSGPEMPPTTAGVASGGADQAGLAPSGHRRFLRKATLDKADAAPDDNPGAPSASVSPLPSTGTRHDTAPPTDALPTHRAEPPIQPGNADLTPPSTDPGQGGRRSPLPDDAGSPLVRPAQPRRSPPPVSIQRWAVGQTSALPAGMTPPGWDDGPFAADSGGHTWHRERAVSTLPPPESHDERMVENGLDRPVDIGDLVDEIAARLHREADLRGIDR